jgi:hypothetical protein
MRKQWYFGAAALVGTVLLFLGWLAEHQRQAAIDRLERWEPSRETSRDQ